MYYVQALLRQNGEKLNELFINRCIIEKNNTSLNVKISEESLECSSPAIYMTFLPCQLVITNTFAFKYHFSYLRWK